ncbi:MAG TPA: PQQ-dependent sugar dehydrogenase [Anaeromyxobacteraceae bacterium]|nr:PQQ-dependent sugar dehydrogenase [Anaeromyxobacteraceae bacterium]
MRVTGALGHNVRHRPLPHRGGRGLAAAVAAVALAACGSGGAGGGSPGAGPVLALTTAQDGLGQVTDVAFLPDGRWVITEKDGAVKVRDTAGTVHVAGTYSVDTASEKGLLGVAVDPAFATTHRIFLYYSASDAAGGTDADRQRAVSVALAADGTLDRAGSERVLVKGLRGPANHDGGALAVGPDGKLYVGVGDSGCNTGAPPEPPSTPDNFFATCLTSGNGKILRVDLDGNVPADGPLAGVSAATACGPSCGVAPSSLAPPRPDLWAWGFRNPWRFWFDPATGLLWVGDVGEASYEEITVALPGRHHGWPWREGKHGWPIAKCRETVPDTGDCVEPVYECRHGAAAAGVDGDCQSITGGLIVDTERWPASARGRYWFSDNVNGRVWSAAVTADRRGIVAGSRREEARIDGGAAVSLRLGPEGDLYLVVLPGRILKLGP